MSSLPRALTLTLFLGACSHAVPPAPTVGPAPSSVPAPQPGSASATPSPPAADAGDLPPRARAVAPSELAGDPACGPFHAKEIEAASQPMLNDRMRVRFVPNGEPAGGSDSAKIEVTRGAATLFIGARETYLRGDSLFERRAAKAATFGGDYDALTIPGGQDGKLPIVTGVVRENKGDRDLLAIAHGWFLDANHDVLDVAVFVSASAITDLAQCKLFAEKLVSLAERGPKTLQYGNGSEVTTSVSYATFRYRLPVDWVLNESMGIHDFARLHFRKRGVFPHGFTELQMALDSHPGDWASRGEETGVQPGQLLGLAVGWHLTSDPGPPTSFGAWTISNDVVSRDHAVASIQASSSSDRDEAVKFAESIKSGR